MKVLNTIALPLLIATHICISSCYTDNEIHNEEKLPITDETNYNAGNYDMLNFSIPYDEYNLKAIDSATNMRNVDLWILEIPSYNSICTVFAIPEELANFTYLKSNTYKDISDQYLLSINAYYCLKSHKYTNDVFDAVINICFCYSQKNAQNLFLGYLDNCTAMHTPRSTKDGIAIGDLAIGDTKRLTFIRGNVFISVDGYNDVSILDLANEFDNMILDFINSTE